MPLTHQWKFNGNLKDSIGSLDFTNLRNLAGYTTGVVQQSFNFPNGYHGPLTSGIFTNSNPFPSAQNAPWTIAFWIRNVVEDTFLYLSNGGKIRLYFKRSTIDDAFIVGFDNDNYAGIAIEKLGTNSKSNVFTHFAVVYTSDSILPKLYINGIEQVYYPDGTTPDPNLLDFVQVFGTENISNTVSNFVISNNRNGYQLDDLRIYDEALNNAAILGIYNSICSEINTETQLVITTQPTATYTNVKLGTSVVEVRNASNSVVTSSNLQVTAEIYTGTGNLVGTTSVQSVNGVATFSNIRIDTPGTFTLRYTNPCLTPAISSSISPTEFLASINNNLTLFIKNNENNNLHLFIKGHGEHVEVLPLYLKSTIETYMPFYLISKPTARGAKLLYLKSLTQNTVSLFTHAHSSYFRTRRLYINSQPSETLPLVIKSDFVATMSMVTLSNINSVSELFVKNSPQNTVNLYITAPNTPSFTNSSLLYMQGDDAIRYYYNGIDLFIRSYLYESVPLYMEVPLIGDLNNSTSLYIKYIPLPEPANNSTTLFLFNNTFKSNGLSFLYIYGTGISQGYYPSNNNMPIFISRSEEYFANSLNTHQIGHDSYNSNKNLSVKGSLTETNTSDFSMPNTHDVYNKLMTMYINGYNPWKKHIVNKNLFVSGSTTTTTTPAP